MILSPGRAVKLVVLQELAPGQAAPEIIRAELLSLGNPLFATAIS
jgi:hypothetical protein